MYHQGLWPILVLVDHDLLYDKVKFGNSGFNGEQVIYISFVEFRSLELQLESMYRTFFSCQISFILLALLNVSKVSL